MRKYLFVFFLSLYFALSCIGYGHNINPSKKVVIIPSDCSEISTEDDCVESDDVDWYIYQALQYLKNNNVDFVVDTINRQTVLIEHTKVDISDWICGGCMIIPYDTSFIAVSFVDIGDIYYFENGNWRKR